MRERGHFALVGQKIDEIDIVRRKRKKLRATAPSQPSGARIRVQCRIFVKLVRVDASNIHLADRGAFRYFRLVEDISRMSRDEKFSTQRKQMKKIESDLCPRC